MGENFLGSAPPQACPVLLSDHQLKLCSFKCEHRRDAVIETFGNYGIFTQCPMVSRVGEHVCKEGKDREVSCWAKLIMDGRHSGGQCFLLPSWPLMESGACRAASCLCCRDNGRLEAQSCRSKSGYFERCFLTV